MFHSLTLDLTAFNPKNKVPRKANATKTHFIKSISLPVAPKDVAAPRTLSEGLGVGVGLVEAVPEAPDGEGEGVADSLGEGLEVDDGDEVALGVGVAEAVGVADELASCAKTELDKSRLKNNMKKQTSKNLKEKEIDILSAYRKFLFFTIA